MEIARPNTQSTDLHWQAGTPSLLLGGTCAVLAFVVMPFDLTLARWFHGCDLPGDLRRLIDYSEVFGHGIGVTLIVLTVARLDHRHWRVLGTLLLYSLMNGLLADVLKLVMRRRRPYNCDFSSLTSVWDTWITDTSQWSLRYDIMSFPSAHTATAVGLACGLSRLYPSARGMFFLFASLAALQRLFEQAHFPSDVLFAAGLALGMSSLLAQPWSLPSRWA